MLQVHITGHQKCNFKDNLDIITWYIYLVATRLHWLVWMPNKNVVNLSIGRFSHLYNTLFWRATKKRELDVMSVTNYVLTFALIGNCYQKVHTYYIMFIDYTFL